MTLPLKKLNPFGSGNLLELEPAQTIHARHVDGRHARWRLALLWLTQLVFYGVPWLHVGGHQAVLFDLEARRFHLFGAVLVPQDLIWLTLLLVASALLLFFATALMGRVWCGFACPQTVYTALFTWIERRCEGDRLARQRLDAAPWTLNKLRRRGAKHLLWVAVSLWTGLSLVGWFTPMRELAPAALTAATGPWESFWILFYGLATWGNAGFLREKVCLHMCPYARFQGALMDEHSLHVGYDPRRGEPRGHHARDKRPAGQGDCVDCTLCVQVCPTGIDIRQGLQSACINCGLCIDACDTVMDKLQAPRGLIRFTSLHELAQPAPAGAATGTGQGWTAPAPLPRRLAAALRRPRVALYGGLLLACATALAVGLWQRPTLRLDVQRDRSVMAREVVDAQGQVQVENLYRVRVVNASAAARTVRLVAVSEDPTLQPQLSPDQALSLAGAEERQVTLRLSLPATPGPAAATGPLPLRLHAVDASTDATARNVPLAEAATTFWQAR
ncbi:cytochrome c oxidase accessory protein CcoG [Ideonella livida]|uniref:Cytochrome c oxidase accessory protein CcoG n=1 Tax=Ideonella livida TaxID=2707176 RepID=A0A7C9TM27_9BURK|nr:cytochrome c oxidase accessory protein CcoG [Ideonella livida]NDY93598.1 cytochrome c oxidase accessory protein CcoG [Ideonella livida]